MGLADAYVDGDWDTDDLPGLLEALVRSSAGLDRVRNRVHALGVPVTDRIRGLRRGDPARDRANIEAHYDLSNDFFALFLDPSMTYSCAVFERPDQSLHDAQVAKLDRLCRKLEIGPDHHVLEIGSGWGSFAVHAAERHGARVTTTTISAAQLDHVRSLVGSRGLDDRVTVIGEHYRALSGSYDRIVSIEMIEAVDWREHDDYAATLRRLLAPGGRVGLQAILIDDADYERAKITTDFIKARVFPGGCLPSETSLTRTLERAGLRVDDIEDLGVHYATTLERWARRLAERAIELPRPGARRGVPPIVGVLPGLLRGGLPRGQDHRRPDRRPLTGVSPRPRSGAR